MSAAAQLVAALIERGWTLGVAESLTGGRLAAEIVSVPGASATLWGAVVAYATPVKATLLGVDVELLAERGPVHPMVAEQMSVGVRSAVQVEGRIADVGISTTGIAGPDSPDGQPVGTVHVGIATPSGVHALTFAFDGDRASIRSQAVAAAIEATLKQVRE